MKKKSFPKVLPALCILSMMFSGVLSADTFRDEFDVDELSDLWDVKIAGNASYEVKDGQLILMSDAVADGINACYSIPLKGDVTCEVKMDTSLIEGDFTHFGFFNGPLEPMMNLDMHSLWTEVFYCGKEIVAGVVNDGQPAANWNRVIGNPEEPIPGDEHIFRIEIKGGHVSFFVDDELRAEADNDVEERYFIISPDPYTSHYSGTCYVDYVELTGNSVVGLAVEPVGKLAATWGDLKTH